VLGQWGPGGASEGQLDSAKAAALEALEGACADKDERRKAAAKVRWRDCIVTWLATS
jgi:hypothetical protein